MTIEVNLNVMEERANLEGGFSNSDNSSSDIEVSKQGISKKEEKEICKRTSIDESEDDMILRSSLLGDEEDEEGSRSKASYFHIPYGFQSIGCYKHASKNCEIGGGIYFMVGLHITHGVYTFQKPGFNRTPVLNLKKKDAYFSLPVNLWFATIPKGIKRQRHSGPVGGTNKRMTYNYRFRQFVILDSRGITSWSYQSVYSTVTRHLNYPAYQFNVLRMIIFSRKFNVYFALSKEYALKVFNLNFHEVISVSAEMHSVLCMVFNPGRNELITGGTGGMKFWRFGELSKDKRKSWTNDSRPMANYGLVLRASYPKMGGSWVKHVELDVAMQRLYCLSERNVVAYDMMGNELFQVKSAHRGPVTGCVYSKSCNLLVTTGNDCDVNVWSRSGGLVHTFSSHTKVITKIMVHPEASGVVITASMDGMVKMFSLDIMEEIYSLPVFHEGISWMDYVSPKIMYCCSNRQIEVFALNHVVDFWALTRCFLRSISLVTCPGKSSRVMAVGSDSSVRLISRVGKTLTTVLPPPSISPLTQVIDVTYSREFNIMYLLIDKKEIWVYYTRTNPATRLEAWKIDYVEDIHTLHSPDNSVRSRAGTPWASFNDGQRSPSSKAGGSLAGSPHPTSPWDGSSSIHLDSVNPHHERVSLTCLGMLYSNIIIESIEGPACPDSTHFLLAGTEDGRVLFLHMFCKGLKYSHSKVHKGSIIGVEHDQVYNVLVVQCRGLNGIDVQFWSLPSLTLLQQITCQDDITCHVRMENLFLSGHESGYIGLHCLTTGIDDVSGADEKKNAPEGKRPQTRDHQGPINSIDGNRSLGIFCSSSSDGFLKVWDKTKTLLREITLDGSLTSSHFLNNGGDVLIGFKQHIFFISRTKVLPAKEIQTGSDDEQNEGDEAFETESDIYEDPSIRYEGKKILQPDPTNMENYLVPFPNLQLKTSFFMEGRPPPEFQHQDLQENLESISSMSDNLSLAPTDIYYSPYSTPRSMSLSSGPIVGRRDSEADEVKLLNADIWELPDFGDSPVSSPPRTPPPEPTPPPTPPPEEITDEEEENKREEQHDKDDKDSAACQECKAPVKSKDKKIINFPSFKRDGGRLSNVRIDSKSLRGPSGPGYAAPVVRHNTQLPEPKQHKPRRPPRITKKTKKPNQPEENKKHESKNTTDANDLNNASNSASNETVAGPSNTEIRAPGTEGANTLPSDTTTASHSENGKLRDLGSAQDSMNHEQYSAPNAQNVIGSVKELQRQEIGKQKNATDEESVGVAAEKSPKEPVQGSLSQLSQDKTKNHKDDQNEAHETPEEENAQNLEHSGINNDVASVVSSSKGGHNTYTDVQYELGDIDEELVRVVYIDPDTGETLEGTLNEVPQGAKIIDINEDGYQDNERIASARGSRQDKKQKSVTFQSQQNENSRRQTRSFVKQKGQDFGGDVFRHQRGWGPKGGMYVVPSEDLNADLQQELVIKGLPRGYNVSPLTIFALARSRKESVARQSRRANSAHFSRSDYSMYSWDKSDVNEQENNTQNKPFNLDVHLPTQEEGVRPSSQLSSVERVKSSSKKPENEVMKWCINALRKSHTQLYIPEKPRPGSSQSGSVASHLNKNDDATLAMKTAIKEGQTLFINVPDRKSPRPSSTATTQSNESRKEYSVYPYKEVLNTDDNDNIPNQRNQIHNIRAKTAPPGRRSDAHIEQKKDSHHDMEPIKDFDGYYTDFYKIQSSDERPVSSLDFPTLDVEDYSRNWQEIVLTRAKLLKQQRAERQKSAKERRQTQHDEQKERWKKSSHFDCAKAEAEKTKYSVDFITTQEPIQQTRTTIHDTTTKQLKEQELLSDRPFRLRIHPRHGSASLTSPARSLITLRSNDHNVEDIARIMPRPKTAASIPNKCSRFVLVSENPTPQPPKPTTLEESLIMTRFPRDRSVKKNRWRQNKHSTRPLAFLDIKQ